MRLENQMAFDFPSLSGPALLLANAVPEESPLKWLLRTFLWRLLSSFSPFRPTKGPRLTVTLWLTWNFLRHHIFIIILSESGQFPFLTGCSQHLKVVWVCGASGLERWSSGCSICWKVIPWISWLSGSLRTYYLKSRLGPRSEFGSPEGNKYRKLHLIFLVRKGSHSLNHPM